MRQGRQFVARHMHMHSSKVETDVLQWSEERLSSIFFFALFQVGKCVKDENSWDGTCTVKWKLSPNTPRGSYYVAMMKVRKYKY